MSDRRADRKGKEGRRRNRNKGGTSEKPWGIKGIGIRLTVGTNRDKSVEDSRKWAGISSLS
jgi:hypothetical protein